MGLAFSNHKNSGSNMCFICEKLGLRKGWIWFDSQKNKEWEYTPVAAEKLL